MGEWPTSLTKAWAQVPTIISGCRSSRYHISAQVKPPAHDDWRARISSAKRSNQERDATHRRRSARSRGDDPSAWVGWRGRAGRTFATSSAGTRWTSRQPGTLSSPEAKAGPRSSSSLDHQRREQLIGSTYPSRIGRRRPLFPLPFSTNPRKRVRAAVL